MMIRELKKLLKRHAGYEVSDLHIVNKPPVTMLGAINPTDYVSVQEGRRIFHLPELSEEELESLLIEKNKIKDGVDNTDTSS
jgi:peptidase E